MKPNNSELLFNFITDRMIDLKNGAISTEAAMAQAQLAKAAIHTMVVEINRAQILLEIEQSNSSVKLREISRTAFQNDNPKKMLTTEENNHEQHSR